MKPTICMYVVPAVLLLPLSLFARCPISPNGTLEVRAPIGNLLVETTGTDAVEIDVPARQITLQETCDRNIVVISGTIASTAPGIPDWKIRVPKGVALDLSTQAGNIQVGDTDGREVRLRTSGGTVITGNIKGNALIVTQANEVRAGNIGGNAELRSQGGKLHVGDVGGDAQFVTTGGAIVAGWVKGRVTADTGSGSILIRESNGDVVAKTQAGDISSDYIRGSFDGRTDSGNIRIERIGSWVHAFTGLGDIFFRLIPEKVAGDFHVKVESGIGNITMYLPEKINATFEAVVDKPAYSAKRIITDFTLKAPVNALKAAPGAALGPVLSLIPGGPERQRGTVNSGGASVSAHTSSGTIRILKGN